MIHKLSELIERSRSKPKLRIAVAAAEDEAVLKSIKSAIKEGVVIPILIGDKNEIERLAHSVDFDLADIQIVHNDKGTGASAQIAVSMIKSGEADILMKGFVSTAMLMKAVLDKEKGLRKGSILSHVAFFESPYYHKLLCVTDAAMNVAPDFEAKVHILNNAVEKEDFETAERCKKLLINLCK